MLIFLILINFFTYYSKTFKKINEVTCSIIYSQFIRIDFQMYKLLELETDDFRIGNAPVRRL